VRPSRGLARRGGLSIVGVGSETPAKLKSAFSRSRQLLSVWLAGAVCF
jgi:hypothetical protein